MAVRAKSKIRQEVEILLLLQNSSIIRIRESFEKDGQLYIFTDFKEGIMKIKFDLGGTLELMISIHAPKKEYFTGNEIIELME